MTGTVDIADCMARDIDITVDSIASLDRNLSNWSQHVGLIVQGAQDLSSAADRNVTGQQQNQQAISVQQNVIRTEVAAPLVSKFVTKRSAEGHIDEDTDAPMQGFSMMSSLGFGGSGSSSDRQRRRP